jgi:hypothetical protein
MNYRHSKTERVDRCGTNPPELEVLYTFDEAASAEFRLENQQQQQHYTHAGQGPATPCGFDHHASRGFVNPSNPIFTCSDKLTATSNEGRARYGLLMVALPVGDPCGRSSLARTNSGGGC